MFAVHGYKWLLSPNGAGFFYIAPQLRERLQPNVVGWRSHRDWRNVDNLHHGAPQFPSTAEKYEGGSVSFALLCAMEASVDLILEIGGEAIEQRVLELAATARGMLRELGASVADNASPIVGARFENRDVSALARALKEQRVLVAARRGHLRVSPHLYNNEQDLEVLQRELRALL
jgi:selenocysteine lyase/cysteine desulfurase